MNDSLSDQIQKLQSSKLTLGCSICLKHVTYLMVGEHYQSLSTLSTDGEFLKRPKVAQMNAKENVGMLYVVFVVRVTPNNT